MTVSTGTMITEATSRGVTSFLMGSVPSALSASICSVTCMDASSEAMPEPTRPAIMIAGRVGSGIASELASMQVTEQIDALRAEGTDPIKKLVTPRLVASVIMVPVLTVITNGIALLGGFVIAHFYLSIDPYFYWTWAFEALRLHDLIYGLIKPIVFGFIICMVGCYAGLNTAGGTVGVGQSTTQAMVTSSILILMTDFFMTKVFVFLG